MSRDVGVTSLFFPPQEDIVCLILIEAYFLDIMQYNAVYKQEATPRSSLVKKREKEMTVVLNSKE